MTRYILCILLAVGLLSLSSCSDEVDDTRTTFANGGTGVAGIDIRDTNPHQQTYTDAEMATLHSRHQARLAEAYRKGLTDRLQGQSEDIYQCGDEAISVGDSMHKVMRRCPSADEYGRRYLYRAFVLESGDVRFSMVTTSSHIYITRDDVGLISSIVVIAFDGDDVDNMVTSIKAIK